jgi:alanine racemase
MLRTRNSEARAAATARLWAEVDLGAVRHNVATLRRGLGRSCRLIAVVKADGYGHGAVQVARAALAAGAAELAVADAREGALLRGSGIDAPILIVGPSAPHDASTIAAHGLVPAVADLELARALAAASRRPLPIEIEVDTGMRRHGVPAADALAFVRALRVHRTLRVRGLFTHFAGLDRRALPGLRAQWQQFEQVVATVRDAGFEVRAHACNTLASRLCTEARADAVRIGGGLYGFDCGGGRGLRPALALKTRVAGLRAAARGDHVGYGSVWSCAAPTTLALLPCGYADGLSRAHWDRGEVLIRGRRRRIVGHVSMNQMVVDVGGSEAALGDEVVLLGAQAEERIGPEERAAPGCSPYEVTALLRPELPRHFLGAPG